MIIHSGENPNNYNNYLLSGVKKVVKTQYVKNILVTMHTVNTMQASMMCMLSSHSLKSYILEQK